MKAGDRVAFLRTKQWRCGNENFKERVMSNLTVWLIAGSATGWLASVVFRTAAQSMVALNVLVGIVGAVVGGSAFAPLMATTAGNQSDFSVPALLMSLVGAAVPLVAIHYLRRRAVR